MSPAAQTGGTGRFHLLRPAYLPCPWGGLSRLLLRRYLHLEGQTGLLAPTRGGGDHVDRIFALLGIVGGLDRYRELRGLGAGQLRGLNRGRHPSVRLGNGGVEVNVLLEFLVLADRELERLGAA